LAGIAAYVKQVRPEVRIIGVNTVDSDSMYQSLLQGSLVDIQQAGLFSDGTSMRVCGQETLKVCQQYVDDMVLVTNDEICAAIKDSYEETRSILEPAGALGIAGLKKYLSQNPELKNGVFVAVSSGANMNFDRLHFVTERASVGQGKEMLASVLIPESPGSLKSLVEFISPRNITELSYRYQTPKHAHVFYGFEVQSVQEVFEFLL
jgi:threonine dehydratase